MSPTDEAPRREPVGPIDSLSDEPSREAEIAGLRAALAAANHQAEEYLDLLRQVRTDFADYRRRTDAGRAEIETQARHELLLRILPILDELQRVLVAPDPERSATGEAGLEAIERRLRDGLAAEGFETIEALGALYNPWEHEALQHQANPELDDQRVLAVLRDGYRIGDRVIRPAQVVVARRGR